MTLLRLVLTSCLLGVAASVASVLGVAADGASRLEAAAGAEGGSSLLEADAAVEKAGERTQSGLVQKAATGRQLLRHEQAQLAELPSRPWEVQPASNTTGSITDLANLRSLKCASRGETCNCEGIPGRVYFGAGKRWLAMDTERTNELLCHEKTFGAIPDGLEEADASCFCCNSTALCPERIE
eukprot:TRINITY_DN93916_c0_g1_i1.p1 TRINITY_DN93916_c0_g1~~TRINITY_DN93916_c0_g1_i1.p1  ORF type:complete len:183 (-),score=47.40 TRINITY_DN93916_c0_g1_i1:60-608(-)